jgi:hypothetical protein
MFPEKVGFPTIDRSRAEKKALPKQRFEIFLVEG